MFEQYRLHHHDVLSKKDERFLTLVTPFTPFEYYLPPDSQKIYEFLLQSVEPLFEVIKAKLTEENTAHSLIALKEFETFQADEANWKAFLEVVEEDASEFATNNAQFFYFNASLPQKYEQLLRRYFNRDLLKVEFLKFIKKSEYGEIQEEEKHWAEEKKGKPSHFDTYYFYVRTFAPRIGSNVGFPSSFKSVPLTQVATIPSRVAELLFSTAPPGGFLKKPTLYRVGVDDDFFYTQLYAESFYLNGHQVYETPNDQYETLHQDISTYSIFFLPDRFLQIALSRFPTEIKEVRRVYPLGVRMPEESYLKLLEPIKSTLPVKPVKVTVPYGLEHTIMINGLLLDMRIIFPIQVQVWLDKQSKKIMCEFNLTEQRITPMLSFETAIKSPYTDVPSLRHVAELLLGKIGLSLSDIT